MAGLFRGHTISSSCSVLEAVCSDDTGPRGYFQPFVDVPYQGAEIDEYIDTEGFCARHGGEMNRLSFARAPG